MIQSLEEGKAIKFHQKSDKRTEPVCEHFEHCGGCKWQHMSYDAQLFYKEKDEKIIRYKIIDWEF